MNIKNTRRGFTLIELLVVVLIVGILAAVALPQYQRAVMKSRNAVLKQMVTSVARAERVYYLTHGEVAHNFNELDMDLPLAAPGTTRSGIAPCSIWVVGSDSLRTGEDFQILLDGGNNVAGVWTKGPYKCAGFRVPLNQEMHCIEANAFYKNKNREGNFCEKLENAQEKIPLVGWQGYALP